MISTAFEYSRATSVDDALAKLRAANGEAKLIARRSQPDPRHEAPSQPAERAHRHRAHSGAVRYSHEGRQDRDWRRHRPSRRRHLRHAAAGVSDDRRKRPASIGDPQVRNRGTLGGSLAHADPSADYPAAMLALDADIHIKGPKGSRPSTRGISSAGCSRSIWRPTSSSSPCSSRRSRLRPTPSCTSARRTSRSSASRPRST